MPTAMPTDRLVHAEPVMGTVVSFDLRTAPSESAAAAARAVQELHRIDDSFSTYKPDSAVSLLGRGEIDVAQVSADVRWIARRCEELRRETAGYFDALASGRFDPSALVKGWAIERAARLLSDAGVDDFCIVGGGDVVCRGRALPGTEWRIGIQHPRDPAALAGVVVGSELAVATSGTYERGEHILDPYRGVPPTGVLSVTVTGPELGTADAYSTAIFAMGASGPEWASALPARGYEALTILADGTVARTPNFPLAEDRL